ncbi:hypothetical protein CCHL11_07156 [Colletotrichum chlorophyti]|uniref:Uncharacterized protein n=1 Tax=Colletotrichum chlorophyti TaxID=708187 RepID=A0A1Q8S0Q1_9PEZI|nr:hypothetical protein CCHL11_07156 [Colletotrichum chlorophyti]
MAPNGNSKARNGVGVANGKPAAARRVVPAIPLPLDRRVKANAAAKQAAAAAAQAAAVTSLPRPAANTTNGSSLKFETDVDSAPPTPKISEPEITTRNENPIADETTVPAPAAAPESEDDKDREATDSQDSSAAVLTPSATDPSDSTDKASERGAPRLVEDSARGNDPVDSSRPVKAPQKENHPQFAPTFRPPPVIPPSRYNMPPAHNGTRPLPVVINGTSHRGPRSAHNGPPHMHGPRPSNGSLQFGGFGSNSSSPAPPHSGGFMPPPGTLIPDGRQFHNHATAATNGYHPQMPYGTEFVPGTAVDGFGRPLPGPGGMEQYPPYANGYGPSTPLSFQGSHSSVHAEETGGYSHYPAPPPGIPNGAAHVDDTRSHPHSAGGFGVPPQRMMPGPPPPPHMMHPGHDAQGLEGLAAYLRSQFRDTAFADCTVELRYLDDRAPPVRIPGHRLVLARSQTIKNYLESDGFESSPPGAIRTILLQSDDKYLRSDAFWMAVQHLYAFPLLELPEPSGNGGLSLAGSADDRFDFALGYSAAGHLLGWQPIVIRGLEIAAHSLSWSTIERALDFSLGDVSGRASADRHTQFVYGEPVQILMNGVISFLINNFPPDFTLDTSVPDPERFARIPFVPPSQPNREGTPTIARGTSGQDRRLRPMHIQFGDLALGSDPGAKAAEPAPLSPQQRGIQSTLSRILLNLPFAYLKPALESSGYGNVNGWASVEARHQIMRAVVNEREARRNKAIEAVTAGALPHAESILYGLRSAEPRQSEEWHGLGWREDVVSYVNGDAPSLGRQWVPLTVHPNGASNLENMERPAYP